MVAHRIELEIARDHAVLGAVDVDIVDAGQELAGEDALAQFGMVERDGERGLVVTVDDAGYAALATHCPGGPLAGPRPRRRLDFFDGRHMSVPLSLQWRGNGPRKRRTHPEFMLMRPPSAQPVLRPTSRGVWSRNAGL